MPLYGYQCNKCGGEFEFLQKFSDPPMTKCEECGGKLSKQLSAPAFHLKGGGWYADGYASTGGPSKDADKGAEAGDKPSKDAGDKASKGDETSKPKKGKKKASKAEKSAAKAS